MKLPFGLQCFRCAAGAFIGWFTYGWAVALGVVALLIVEDQLFGGHE